MTAPATRRRVAFLMLATGVFGVLTIVAMLVYDGGSLFDSGARHYQFFGNFFSDLGATVTYSGRTNIASRALFVVALTSVGVAFAWSAPAWRCWAVRDAAHIATTLTRVAAISSGLGFIGIAVTPPNSARNAHIALVQITFTLLLVFVANLVVVQARNGIPRRWIATNVALLVLLGAYVVLVIGGPNLNSFDGARIQIVAQKIVVYAAILDLSFQAWGITRLSSPSRAAGDRPRSSIVPAAARGLMRPAPGRRV